MRYVYVLSEPGLWTVGFYKPSGEWEPESDHGTPDEAANRVAWLNGRDAARGMLDEALNTGDGVYRP